MALTFSSLIKCYICRWEHTGKPSKVILCSVESYGSLSHITSFGVRREWLATACILEDREFCRGWPSSHPPDGISILSSPSHQTVQPSHPFLRYNVNLTNSHIAFKVPIFLKAVYNKKPSLHPSSQRASWSSQEYPSRNMTCGQPSSGVITAGAIIEKLITQLFHQAVESWKRAMRSIN